MNGGFNVPTCSKLQELSLRPLRLGRNLLGGSRKWRHGANLRRAVVHPAESGGIHGEFSWDLTGTLGIMMMIYIPSGND